MSEELTPEQIEAASRLAHFKQTTLERIVSHMNGVGASIVQSYPMAEVQSWTIQKGEAEAVHAIGEAALASYSTAQMLSVAPFLVNVCVAHHGPAGDDATLAAQLWTKAVQVKANADLWASLSAFVNGLRARASDQIEAATSETQVYEIESATQTELSAFRATYGV